MSVGGIVSQVIFSNDQVLVEVTDRGCRQWRSLPMSARSRCIGIGDSLWWQNHRGFWTPKERTGNVGGASYDIKVGRCFAIETPKEAAHAR